MSLGHLEVLLLNVIFYGNIYEKLNDKELFEII